MTPPPQRYFTTLKPFARYFESGVPILTYHKLGPSRRHARMKGLYVSERLFRRQLAELQAAGFATAPYQLPDSAAGNPQRRIVITFDDGFRNVLRYGLEPLARHGFRAIQFLVANRLGGENDWETRESEAAENLMNESEVREWLAAGHEIGSHTLTHPWLTRLAPSEARKEIRASKRKLEDTFSVAVRHFCYPYGDWNPAVRDAVREAGYETACTTEFGVNTAATPAWELRRIMARYQSLSLKAIRSRLGWGARHRSSDAT